MLQRHPQHDITRFNLGHVFAETGRSREAIPHFARLVQRQPFWSLARMQYARALIASGRLDEGDEQMEVALRLWPRRLDIWSTRIRQLLLSGRSSEALAFVENESAQPLDDTRDIELERMFTRAFVEASPSLRQAAVQTLVDRADASALFLIPSLLDLTMLGELDPAFQMLEGFYFGRGRWGRHRSQRPSTVFLFNRMSTPLRQDARFQPLVEEIGLESFWRERRIQPDYRRFA